MTLACTFQIAFWKNRTVPCPIGQIIYNNNIYNMIAFHLYKMYGFLKSFGWIDDVSFKKMKNSLF